MFVSSQALISNVKIEVIEGDKFRYKPKHKIPDKKRLMRLLESHDTKGLGGILLEDVEESLPNCAKVLKVFVLHFKWDYIFNDCYFVNIIIECLYKILSYVCIYLRT